jgi:hypothetical protein
MKNWIIVTSRAGACLVAASSAASAEEAWDRAAEAGNAEERIAPARRPARGEAVSIAARRVHDYR